MSKIRQVYTKVLILLKEHEKYRNSDEVLCARIWWEESQGITDKMKFLDEYVGGNITPADAITRARRKAQENYPELEGAKKKARRDNVPKIKDEIKSLKKKDESTPT